MFPYFAFLSHAFFHKSRLCIVVLQHFCQQCDYLWVENQVSTPEKWALNYQHYVAPVMTTMLCLLVISLESLICSFCQFVPLLLTKEWVITQAWTGLGFFGIQGSGTHKVPVFSLEWGEGEGGGLTVNCLVIAAVNKPRAFPFSFFPSCRCLRTKRLVGEPWEQRWHQRRTGFPSSRSRSQLQAADETQQGGCS